MVKRLKRGAAIAGFVGLALSALVPATPVQGAAGCVSVGEELAIALFNQMDEALSTLHPDKVARLFSPDGSLIVGSVDHPRQGYDTIRDYYFNLLQREPRLIPQERTMHFGCNQVIDSGTAALVLRGGRAGLTDTILVRYTLAYELTSHGWRISHHHLSEVRPTGASDRLINLHQNQKPIIAIPQDRPAGPRVAGYVRRIDVTPRTAIVRRYRPKREPGLFDDYKAADWKNGQPAF